jgi:type I site-specific restriction endonuclease
MTDEQAMSARLTAIAERLKEFIRKHQSGGCRMLSVADCQCPLCDVDRLSAHVETLEREKAQADERARLSYPGLAEIERIQQENARLTARIISQPEIVFKSLASAKDEAQRLAGLCEEWYEKFRQAEQARDTAHAAHDRLLSTLRNARNFIAREHGMTQHEFLAYLDAALAASAPQKEK